MSQVAAPMNRQAARWSIPPPPVLGEKYDWSGWLERIEVQAAAHMWGDMLHDATTQLDQWPMAKLWLIQAVPDEDFHLVKDAENWVQAIERLKQTHSVVDNVNGLNLTKQLFSLVMLPNESVSSIISRCKKLASSLKSMDAPVTDAQLLSAVIKVMEQNRMYADIMKSLLSMPGSILTIESLQTAFNVITPPPIGGALVAQKHVSFDVPTPSPNPYYEQMKELTESLTSAVAYLASGNKPRGGKGNGGRGGRGYEGYRGNTQRKTPYGRGSGRGTSNGNRGGRNGDNNATAKFDGDCGNCGKWGHVSKKCYKPCGICGSEDHKRWFCPRNKENGKGNVALGTSEDDYDYPVGRANMTRGIESNFPPGFQPSTSLAGDFEVIGKASKAGLPSVLPTPKSWILDSGASHHMIPMKNVLFNYVKDTRPAWVEVADNKLVPRAGVGSIRIQTVINGQVIKKEIQGVWHVPALGRCLLSVNELKRQHCWHHSGKTGDMTEYFYDKNDKLWLQCYIKDGLNVPDFDVMTNPGSPEQGESVSATQSGPVTQAHAYYSHPNHATDKQSPEL